MNVVNAVNIVNVVNAVSTGYRATPINVVKAEIWKCPARLMRGFPAFTILAAFTKAQRERGPFP